MGEESWMQWTPSNLATLGTSQNVLIRGGGLTSGGGFGPTLGND